MTILNNWFISAYLLICLSIFLVTSRLWYKRKKLGTLDEYNTLIGVNCIEKIFLLSLPVVNVVYIGLFWILVLIIGVADYKEKWSEDAVTIVDYWRDAKLTSDTDITISGLTISHRCTVTERIIDTARINHCLCSAHMDDENSLLSKVDGIGYVLSCASCGKTISADTQLNLIRFWNDINPSSMLLESMTKSMTRYQKFKFRVKFCLTYYLNERGNSDIFKRIENE